jgi:hypothetical protein
MIREVSGNFEREGKGQVVHRRGFSDTKPSLGELPLFKTSIQTGYPRAPAMTWSRKSERDFWEMS